MAGIEATSAAPLMFPRCKWIHGMQMVDGGLVTNDPTIIAIREAQALWPGRPIGVIVSLGTGDSKLDDETREGRRLERIGEFVRREHPGAGYFRFQPHLPNDDLSPFDHDEPRLQQMEEATRKDFWRSRSARDGDARELVKILDSSRGRLITTCNRATEKMRRARRLNKRVYAKCSAHA